MSDIVEQLRALERQVEREWWWLNGALHAIAWVQADQARGAVVTFREMQKQAREIDCKRLQIAARIAELEGPLNEHS